MHGQPTLARYLACARASRIIWISWGFVGDKLSRVSRGPGPPLSSGSAWCPGGRRRHLGPRTYRSWDRAAQHLRRIPTGAGQPGHCMRACIPWPHEVGPSCRPVSRDLPTGRTPRPQLMGRDGDAYPWTVGEGVSCARAGRMRRRGRPRPGPRPSQLGLCHVAGERTGTNPVPSPRACFLWRPRASRDPQNLGCRIRPCAYPQSP